MLDQSQNVAVLRVRLAASALLILGAWAVLLYAAVLAIRTAVRSGTPGLALLLALALASALAFCAMLLIAPAKASHPPIVVGIIGITLYASAFAFVAYGTFAAVLAIS